MLSIKLRCTRVQPQSRLFLSICLTRILRCCRVTPDCKPVLRRRERQITIYRRGSLPMQSRSTSFTLIGIIPAASTFTGPDVPLAATSWPNCGGSERAFARRKQSRRSANSRDDAEPIHQHWRRRIAYGRRTLCAEARSLRTGFAAPAFIR